MGRKKKGIPGLSYSWKRAIGLSSAKGKLSRIIGIPLTRSGRQRKMGRMMGCSMPLFILIICIGATAVGIANIVFSVSM